MPGPYWTDAWNIVTGCTPISPGCLHCWAARQAATRLKNLPEYAGLARAVEPWRSDTQARYEWTGEVRFHPSRLDQPLHWRKPRVVFTCNMGDLFHEVVTDEQIVEVFDVMRRVWNWHLEGREPHRFLLLTKRPERMRDICLRLRFDGSSGGRGTYLAEAPDARGYPLMPHKGSTGLPNVWLGTTVCTADELWKVDVLRETPAAHRWLSLEPLLSALPDLDLTGIDGVVLGGESGPGARPMDPTWALDVWRQCREAGVPFMFKQWGSASRGFEDICPLGIDEWREDVHDAAEMVATKQLPWEVTR